MFNFIYFPLIYNSMRKEFILIILFLMVLVFVNPEIKYDSDLVIEPDYVLKAAGVDSDMQINRFIDEYDRTSNLWGKGDILLVLARLENNTEYYRHACADFRDFSPENDEERAIKYETLASLNCYGERIHNLFEAAYYWRQLGVEWRAGLLEKLVKNEKLELEFDTSEIKPVLNLSGKEKIVIGNTKVEIKKGDTVVTQVDRVFRDWLGAQMQNSPFRGNILNVFSEKWTLSEEELREDIGWHEGGRILDIKNNVDINHVPAVGTLVAKKNNKWYASDENGVFRFEVPLDKVSYPTTRFLSKDLGMIVDSHGMNMLVEQAIRNNAEVVIACCDHPGKAKAVKYLSDKGISAICFTDLYFYLLAGHDVKAVGSAPFEVKDDKIVFGDRPVEIDWEDSVVMLNALVGKTYSIWYYKTPALFFDAIQFPHVQNVVHIDDFNQTDIVFDRAREINANIAASRVFNKFDYDHAKKWLEESEEHKLILFHSMSYPYGILISTEFPEQIGFGDVNI